MTEIINLNNENFEKSINDSEKPIIVDFWAEWCGPCKMLTPIIEELASELHSKIIFAKVNLDENQDLAMKYSIRSIPSLLLFLNGELKDTKIGLVSKEDLKIWIDENI